MVRLIPRSIARRGAFLTELLFPKVFGWCDFKRGRRFGRPFNGQSGRMRLAERVIAECEFDCFVETGTWRGGTTAWFADTGQPVYTVELNPRWAHFSRLRFGQNDHVHLAEMDSAAFLKSLATNARITESRVMFYLDAHWNDRLPLAEELQIIASNFPSSVVMIDDFQVPDDPGYGFDDYGPGKRLDVDYVVRSGVAEFDFFFPALPGSEETGARRGCVVLTHNPGMAARLRRVPLLRMIAVR